MGRTNQLEMRYPRLGDALDRVRLAELPTPVAQGVLRVNGFERQVWIKEDDLTGVPYGGNKLRKLEYLFRPPMAKGRERIATFGAAGSHHALATALYANKLGFASTVFLAHQRRTASVPATLNMHIRNGSEIVYFGGSHVQRMTILRQHLWGRNAWVVPTGGSSWLGTVGFVNAGLELAAQISAGQLPTPGRIYVATGTMSTAAGLGLGLALAGVVTEVHAVRVSEPAYARQEVIDRLSHKTCYMLNRIDPGFPSDLHVRSRIVLRHEFFGSGYAHSTPAVDEAIGHASSDLGIELEATYTGKAMAALIDDLRSGAASGPQLFWNTYHSAPLPVPSDAPLDRSRLPDAFLNYFPGD